MTEPSRNGGAVKMTPQTAARILTDGRFAEQLLDEAIDRLQRTTLDIDPVTVENLLKRKGQIEGLRIAKSFYVEAQLMLIQTREDVEEAHQSLSTEMAPPALVHSVIEPLRPAVE